MRWKIKYLSTLVILILVMATFSASVGLVLSSEGKRMLEENDRAQESTEGQLGDLGDYTIAVDPGHGGSDPGAVGPSGYTEKECALDIGIRLRDLLEASNADVVMTREGDYDVSLQERCDIANNAGADIFVSIHNNAFDGTVKGIESFYYEELPPDSEAAQLTTLLQEELIAEIDSPDRGVKTANFYVLRNTWMPASLTENMFIDNPEEEAKLMDPSVRQRIAEAHYRAICDYFGEDPSPPEDADFVLNDWSLSPNTVEPDETVTIEGEVENIGSGADDVAIELYIDGDYTDTQWIHLGPGDTTWVSFEHSESAEGTYDVWVFEFYDGVGDDWHGEFTVEEGAEPAEFVLNSWDVDPQVVEPDETVTIEGEVENIGGAEGQVSVDIYIDGNFEDSTYPNPYLGPSESESIGFTVSRSSLGTYDVDVHAFKMVGGEPEYPAHDSWSSAFEVVEEDPPYFQIEWVSAPDVIEGETLEVQASIENTGDESDTQTVEMTSGVGGDSVSITLNGGESTTEIFTVSTVEGDAGSYTATVSSDDDSDQDSFEVIPADDPPFFAITSVNAIDVVEGQTVEVAATIENIGDKHDTQEVHMTSGVGDDSTSLSLNGGESTTETFITSTSEGDAGSYTATVSSDDDSDSDHFKVIEDTEEAYFSVQDIDAENVVEGETLDITATIENLGNEDGTQDIVFSIDGVQEDVYPDLYLAEGERYTCEFTWKTEEAGEYELEVASHDDSETVTVTVEEEVVEHTLTIDVQGEGSTVPEAGTHIYESGEEVTLTATSNDGWYFNGWTGDHESKEKETTISVNSDMSITAHFDELEEDERTLTIYVKGEGTTDPNPGVHVYEEDTEVEVSAEADAGWKFIYWEDDFPEGQEEENEITLIMDADKTLTANFEEDVIYHDLNIESTEGGEVVGPGEGTHTYEEGDVVELEAVADEGYKFVNWTNDVENIDDVESRETTITMEDNYTITAMFEEIGRFELTVKLEGQGEVDIYPEKEEYEEGTEVILTASADEDWQFIEWTGDATGTDEETTIIMDDDKEITAHFSLGPLFEVDIVRYDKEVVEGEEAVLDYVVTNTGGLEATQTIRFIVDGELQDSEEVTLGPGEMYENGFSWKAQEQGEFRLEIISYYDEDVASSEQVSVSVVEELIDEKPEDEETSFWWLILIAIAVIGIILALLLASSGKQDEKDMPDDRSIDEDRDWTR